MTRDEAIKILEVEQRVEADSPGSDIEKAHKLGIEALRAIQVWNHKQLPQFQIHLPGETES